MWSKKTNPRDHYHIHVKLKQDLGSQSLYEELFGSVLFLYYELLERLKPLYQRRMGSPNIRDELGSEKIFYEYPEIAIVEALTNFLFIEIILWTILVLLLFTLKKSNLLIQV